MTKLDNRRMPATNSKAICSKGFGGNSRVLARSYMGVCGQESSLQFLIAATLNRD
jgi:hypothetical protein